VRLIGTLSAIAFALWSVIAAAALFLLGGLGLSYDDPELAHVLFVSAAGVAAGTLLALAGVVLRRRAVAVGGLMLHAVSLGVVAVLWIEETHRTEPRWFALGFAGLGLGGVATWRLTAPRTRS
jgi:hypothetical protein